MADPVAVPATYGPNYSLTWVKSATHIWALHPSSPYTPDKGGMKLRLDSAQTGGTPVKTTGEYSTEFKGAAGEAYYTDDGLIFGGDDGSPPAVFALSCWVYMYAFGAGGKNTGLLGQPATLNPWLGIMITTGQISASVNGTSTFTGVSLNTWTHLTLTNDASFRRIYKNGVKVVEAANNSDWTSDESLYFGRTSGRTAGSGSTIDTLSGRMRLVMLRNGAIWTDAEILEQFNRPYAYYGTARPTIGTFYLSDLKIELNTDPMGYGYATHITSGAMQKLADLLNVARLQEMPMPRNTVTREQMNSCLYDVDYYALTAARQSLWNAYTREDIDMRVAPAMRTQIEGLFPVGAYTIERLQTEAWNTYPSRAEVLWGIGTLITWEQCKQALAS